MQIFVSVPIITKQRRQRYTLARHSTYALTARYTHSRFYDLAAAVQGLPIPTGNPDRQAVALAPTGTDGRNPSKNSGLNLGPYPAISGDFLRLAETADSGLSQQENPGKQAVSAAFQGGDNGMSKMEPTGIEPVTSALRTLRSPN